MGARRGTRHPCDAPVLLALPDERHKPAPARLSRATRYPAAAAHSGQPADSCTAHFERDLAVGRLGAGVLLRYIT